MNQHAVKESATHAALVAVLAFALLSLGPAAPSHAEMCVADVVPAATLLVPYFEVDYETDDIQSLVTIHNSSPEPTLVHVTLWSDWGHPVVDFDMFLTGYDVQAMSLNDLFDGNIPITADEQSDDFDSISPHGDPSWDGSKDDCQHFFPFFVNPVIKNSNLERLLKGMTGQPIEGLDDDCLGSASPGLARGYITFDVVSACSTEFPNDSGYAATLLDDDNRLFGDITIQRVADETTVTLPLVHIEADPDFDDTSTASGETFYGRFHPDGLDHREPLVGSWAFPFYDGDTVTEVLVWRNSGGEPPTFGESCESGPPWAPLGQTSIQCWNEVEEMTELCGGAECFPLETQRIPIGDLSVPYASGWCRVDLDPQGGLPIQSWVGVIHEKPGVWATGLPAISLEQACTRVD